MNVEKPMSNRVTLEEGLNEYILIYYNKKIE